MTFGLKREDEEKNWEAIKSCLWVGLAGAIACIYVVFTWLGKLLDWLFSL